MLKPGGCLAVYAHDLVQTKSAEVNELIYRFYTKLDAYWHYEFRHIKNEYKNVVIPFANVERVQSIMSHRTSLPGLIGFISSWSSYRAYMEACPEVAAHQLEELSADIEAKLDKMEREDKSHQCKVQSGHFHRDSLNTYYPVYLVMGQKGKSNTRSY